MNDIMKQMVDILNKMHMIANFNNIHLKGMFYGTFSRVEY